MDVRPDLASPPEGVAVERVGEAVVLVLSGEVSYGTIAPIKDAMLAVLSEGPATLVVDLLAVTFLGSAGLALLIEAKHLADRQATDLRLVAAGPATFRQLQVTGLQRYFSPYPTRQAALTATTDTGQR